MLANLLFHGAASPTTPVEGELYKEVTVGGRPFRLVYGYYEDFERESPFNEPIPIYPDLLNNPVYTAQGIPIVTAMQYICSSVRRDTPSRPSTGVAFLLPMVWMVVAQALNPPRSMG